MQESAMAQIGASDAERGRVWRQLVRQKIRNQGELLKAFGKDGAKRLFALADEVKNHDSANCEAQAARIYFRELAPSPDFTRDPDGTWPNSALNYGYAILRAAVARSLVGSGLVCFCGVHHHNRYDPLCLADDAMEPFRPFVDRLVFGGEAPFDRPAEELTKEMKAALLGILACDVKLGGVKRPLMVALPYMTASLARFFKGEGKELSLPAFA